MHSYIYPIARGSFFSWIFSSTSYKFIDLNLLYNFRLIWEIGVMKGEEMHPF